MPISYLIHLRLPVQANFPPVPLQFFCLLFRFHQTNEFIMVFPVHFDQSFKRLLCFYRSNIPYKCIHHWFLDLVNVLLVWTPTTGTVLVSLCCFFLPFAADLTFSMCLGDKYPCLATLKKF